MKKLTTWSKAHTVLSVLIVAGVGYLAYTKWGKKSANGQSASFTGDDNTYLNADAPKDTGVKKAPAHKTVLIDINRPKCQP